MLFAQRVALLEAQLSRIPSLVVALSGGVDSAVLLGVAARVLEPGRIAAATTASAAVPREEIEDAAAVAARAGVPHHVVPTSELDDPDYRANAGDRCYFCRREMYGVLLDHAASHGFAHVADGLQADDPVSDRPGVRAAKERGVLHPLREAGFSKPEIRRLARALALPIHAKPAQPCLASRIPVGLGVTTERLARIERAERSVRALGFRQLRVRCEDRHGRVEIGRGELPAALARADQIAAAVVAAGFDTAHVDPAPYGASSQTRG
jgi:uncharacterized protein